MQKALFALALPLLLVLALAGHAQTVAPPEDAFQPAENAQTLDDILARQAGQADQRQPRADGTSTDAADAITSVLGSHGSASDPALWEALRFGTADVRVSAGGPQAKVLIQDGGMWWLNMRKGPVAEYGGWLLLGTIGLLLLFYLLRGKIRVDSGLSGVRILRFAGIERFGHWLLAGSFVLLALTGLFELFGRLYLIDLIGKEAYATLAGWSKWIHDSVSWAFIAGLILIFLMWVRHNLPGRHDLAWFLRGGGIIGHAHPPAKKFNAGQKLVFWAVVLLGASVAASGLSLLFPFELPMFAKTFAAINHLGLPGLFGVEPLPTQLGPHEEMQYALLWHITVAFVLMAIIIAHIYIGTVGMEGAAGAMVEGEVDLNWAREHHSLWVEEVQAKAPSGAEHATPAE